MDRLMIHKTFAFMVLFHVGTSNAEVEKTLIFDANISYENEAHFQGEIKAEFFQTNMSQEPLGDWFEDHLIETEDGRFLLLIGQGGEAPLPVDIFDQPVYLELTVEQIGRSAERLPRLLIGGAPYALRASKADQLIDTPLQDFAALLTGVDAEAQQGPEGERGPRGEQGPEGAPGVAGITPEQVSALMAQIEALEAEVSCLEGCIRPQFEGCMAWVCEEGICNQASSALPNDSPCLAQESPPVLSVCLEGACQDIQ